jgi:hypothetical protein
LLKLKLSVLEKVDSQSASVNVEENRINTALMHSPGLITNESEGQKRLKEKKREKRNHGEKA